MARVAMLNIGKESFDLSAFSYTFGRLVKGVKKDGNPDVGKPQPGAIIFTVRQDTGSKVFHKAGEDAAIVAGSIVITDEGAEAMNLSFSGGKITQYSEKWEGTKSGEETAYEIKAVVHVKELSVGTTKVSTAQERI